MDSMKPWTITCTFFCLLLLGTECLAQTATTADLNALEGAQGAGGPGGALPVYSNATAASKVFKPDIAVIGDFIGVSGSNHVNPDPALQMHESEVVAFQAIVDPYA
jgi:hypothetical protein